MEPLNLICTRVDFWFKQKLISVLGSFEPKLFILINHRRSKITGNNMSRDNDEVHFRPRFLEHLYNCNYVICSVAAVSSASTALTHTNAENKICRVENVLSYNTTILQHVCNLIFSNGIFHSGHCDADQARLRLAGQQVLCSVWGRSNYRRTRMGGQVTSHPAATSAFPRSESLGEGHCPVTAVWSQTWLGTCRRALLRL